MKPSSHVRRVLIAGLLGILAKVAETGVAQQPAKKPYTLMVKSVKVKPTKPDGSPWDTVGGPPDLTVRIVLTDAARHKQLQALFREREPLERKLSALAELKKEEMRLQAMKLDDPRRTQQAAKLKAKQQEIRPLDARETARLAELQAAIAKLQRDLFIDTAEASNTLEAVIDTGSLGVAAGDELTILVQDRDFVGHDEIGTLKHKLTAEQVKQGEVELTFGQVIALKLSIKLNQ